MTAAAITQVVAVNGTRLRVERSGGGAGPTLVFLHGATLDHRMWQPQIDALADRHPCVRYDLRGHGGSDLPTATPYRHYEDAAALIDHLGLDRVIPVGHSIGGLYALELALARPDRVVGLAMICMSGLGRPPFPDEVIAMFAAIRAAARDHGLDAARAIWARGGWFAAAREQPALAAQLERWLAEYSGWHWTHANPADNLVPPALERLGALAVPTLVVDGGRDLAYNHEIAVELVRGVPDATLLALPAAGHMANLEDPIAVNRALDQLAARVT
jgi:pimeloyl-ACP methyl ester carboxylesterase